MTRMKLLKLNLPKQKGICDKFYIYSFEIMKNPWVAT